MTDDPDENLYIDREENGCHYFDACSVNECPLNLRTKQNYYHSVPGDPQTRCHLPIADRQAIIGSMLPEHKALLKNEGLQAWEYKLKLAGSLQALIEKQLKTQSSRRLKAQAMRAAKKED